DEAGNLNSLPEQDRSKWDRQLIAQGLALLEHSAAGDVVSAFHVEAAIAAAHATASNLEDTDWRAIVGLYDRLMAIAPSPVVALNRAIAIGQRDGPDRGLDALLAIDDSDRLHAYPFYPAALGELELRRGNRYEARAYFSRAASLARSDLERRFLERRIHDCKN